jgi:hypothetical protein
VTENVSDYVSTTDDEPVKKSLPKPKAKESPKGKKKESAQKTLLSFFGKK